MNKPMSDHEVFARLSAALAVSPARATVPVTRPLKKNGAGFFVEIRAFEANSA
jgi:hypothetical protein